MKKDQIKELFKVDRNIFILEFLKDQGLVVERIRPTLKSQLRIKYESEGKSLEILAALQRLVMQLDSALERKKGSVRVDVQYIGSSNEIKITLTLKRI